MNAGKSFFDTNVLLYMHSKADLAKQAQAKKVFRECLQSGRIVVSTQVVQEFHAVASRKLGIPREVLRIVTIGLLDLTLVQVGPAHIRRALGVEEQYQISFWDALILAAAESAGASVLYTEDLNDGQQYGTVRVENPFRLRQDT
jgi:predicted nucleic acid-binding protein